MIEHKLRPPGATGAATGANKASHLKFWLMLGLVIVILLLVLLALPKMVSEPTDKQPRAVAEKTAAPVVEEPPDSTTVQQLRQETEQALQTFLRLQARPDLSNAEVWASEQWHAAMNTAASGDKEFGQESFSAALKTYKNATAQLQTILDEREQTLNQSLADGWQFLQDNEIASASSSFERVLAMQADHQQAQLGLERTSVRAAVLDFMRKGQQAEITDNLQLAADAYSAALGLDMLYIPAQEALEKTTLELKNLAFQDAMGKALENLHNGKFLATQQALLDASKIYPDDPAIADTRQRLQTAQRQSSLGSLRQAAEHLVKQEQWAAARDKYKRALSIDSQAAFARNGLARSEEKLELHKQLDHYLADVTRLYSPDPLNNASKLLAANKQILRSEPKLAAKLNSLEKAVNIALIPIDLLIVSDNLTAVTIYKVGRQGSFLQKQLSLRPGKYTITGSRQGYRDVLKVFELQPGVSGQTVTIRSEDKF